MAISGLLSARGHRKYGTTKAARERVRAMTESEVTALASQRGRELCAAAHVMPQQDVDFYGALEQVRAMTESEVTALAGQRGRELCAAAQVMSQQDVDFYGALEQVRAMTESEVTALASRSEERRVGTEG